MNLLNGLFEGQPLDYLRTTESAFPPTEASWFLVHIPKTAGSSLREEMADVLQPDVNVEVDYKSINSSNPASSFDSLIIEAIDNLANVMRSRHIPFASGHVLFRDVKPRLHDKKIAYTTVLREPIDRLLSDYSYRTSAEHPLSAEEKRRFPTFKDYVLDPVNQNVMLDYLRQTTDDDLSSALRMIEENFALVGVMEFYPLMLKVQMALLGCRAKFTHSIRRSGVSASDKRRQISPEDIALASSLNSNDVALYQHFHARWQKVAAGLHYYFDFDRIFKMKAGLPHQL